MQKLTIFALIILSISINGSPNNGRPDSSGEGLTMEVVGMEAIGETAITDLTPMEDGIMEKTGEIMADLTLMEDGTVVTMEVIGATMEDLIPTQGAIMVTVMVGMEEATTDLNQTIMEVLVVTLVTMEAAIVVDLTQMEVGEENRLQKMKQLMWG